MCYVGLHEKSQEYLATIPSWDGEPCLLNEVDEKAFCISRTVSLRCCMEKVLLLFLFETFIKVL